MDGYQCIRCSKFWATNAIDGASITRYCPDCIPIVFPYTLCDKPLSVKWTEHLDRRVVVEEVEARVQSMRRGMRTNRKHLVSEQRRDIVLSRRRRAS